MSEPVSMIGANTVVNGSVEGDEDLTVEGRVEGGIKISKTLTIEPQGVVHADIVVRNAVIKGVLVGNVQAEESVRITEEGRVVGDISAPRVFLVEGASFRGKIDMGDFDVDGNWKPHAVEPPNLQPAARQALAPKMGLRETRDGRAFFGLREPLPSRGPARPTPKTQPDAKPHKPAPPPLLRKVGKAIAFKKERTR